jgi:3-dehydrotetronate 4-kinase
MDIMTEPRLGIIADDYTGALMVACYLEGAGIYSPLVFDPHEVRAGSNVVVAGARIRTIPAQEALSEVESFANAFLTKGYANIVYKPSAGFDSSPQGNIGQAADWLADRVSIRPTIMAAGFPSYEITTHQGCLFYRGKIVSESIKRFDPLTPMSDPDLVRFLSTQTPHRIGLVNHLTMQSGLSSIEENFRKLEASGVGHVFFDVSDATDLLTVARYAAGSGKVLIASDPVAVEYAKVCAAGQLFTKPVPRHARGPAAVLVGTVGPVIQGQLRSFATRYPVLDVDLANAESVEIAADRAIKWATEHLGNRPFAVTTTADPKAVEKAQEIFGKIGAARRAEEFLALIAKQLHDRGTRRFVVAGGETSGAVVSSLGIKAVRALPEGPLGTGFCVTEGKDPISLFLKPGKHGDSEILINALEAMN